VLQQTGGFFSEPSEKRNEFQGVINKYSSSSNSKSGATRSGTTNGNNDKRGEKEREREPISINDDDSNDVLEIAVDDPSNDDSFLDTRKRSYSDLSSASVHDSNNNANNNTNNNEKKDLGILIFCIFTVVY
jgi:hypothetical protein